jgi:hypothetical protein
MLRRPPLGAACCGRRVRRVQSSLPEPLGWDAERSVEARGRVLPRDDHRQFSDGVVVVVSLQAREELIVDVAARVRHRVGVFERHNLRITEEGALDLGRRLNKISGSSPSSDRSGTSRPASTSRNPTKTCIAYSLMVPSRVRQQRRQPWKFPTAIGSLARPRWGCQAASGR